MANSDRIKEVRTYTHPKGVVRVHIPDLTEEERERRMKIIADAAADLLRSKMDNEMKKEREVHMA